MSNIKVFKFGGASIRDVAAIQNVASIVKDFRTGKTIIIVSALGKTTNALEEVVETYFNDYDQVNAKMEIVKVNHFNILAGLFPPDHQVYSIINDFWVEIDWIVEEKPKDTYDYVYDQIVSIGELMSSSIVDAYFNLLDIRSKWLDARDLIRTDDIYREGSIIWDDTLKNVRNNLLPQFEEYDVVVTQGFIGSTADNNTVTLGREGSDFSAAILSHCTDAEDMTIWKDVPGVLSADPRLFDNVVKLDHLSYLEAVEMTYYGASVIHPKTIKPLQNKNIPLYVKSFISPDGEGTLISNRSDLHYPPIVVVEKNQTQISIAPKDFSFVVEHHLAHLFQLFAKHRLFVNMMRNTAVSFSVIVTNIPDRIHNVIDELRDNFNIHKEDGLELITIRHYNHDIVEQLKKDKLVILEESIPKTIQMVVKDIPKLMRKEP